MTIYNAAYHRDYYQQNRDRLDRLKKLRLKGKYKRSPGRVRQGFYKLLSHELTIEDAFVFEGKDISPARERYYRRIIR